MHMSNKEEEETTNIHDKHEEEEPEILICKVQNTIKALKDRKSPGTDNVNGELIKNGGEITAEVLHRICNRILN